MKAPDCVASGTRVCFAVQPAFGYKLDRWLINGKATDNENPICRIVTKDTVFEPRFKKITLPDENTLKPNEKKLFSAIREHNREAVFRLLKTIGNPDFRAAPGWETPLFAAIKAGDPEIVKLLLKKGADARQTLQYKIIDPGKPRSAFQFLLPRSALEIELRTPRNSAEIVKELVNAGADVNEPIGINGAFSPLFLALQGPFAIDGYPPAPGSSYHADKDIVNFLIDRGADIHGVNPEGKPVLYCTLSAGLDSVASRLMNAGVWKTMTTSQKRDVLSLVAESNKPEWVKRILKTGVDLNGPWPNRHHPLLSAINRNYVAVADILLKNGMNPKFARFEKPEKNNNLIRQTVRWTQNPFEFDAILTLLCSHGADINGWVQSDESPIPLLTDTEFKKQQTGGKFVTVFKRRKLRILIAHGLDVAGHPNWTNSPGTKWALAELKKYPSLGKTDEKLVVAISEGETKEVQALLRAGANPNVSPGGPGNEALGYSILSKKPEISKLLIRNGANLEPLISLENRKMIYFHRFGLKSVTPLGLSILMPPAPSSMMMTLIKAGANMQKVGLTADHSRWCSALNLLVETGHCNGGIIEFMVRQGDKLPLKIPQYIQNWGGVSLLRWAIYYKMPMTIQYLLKRGDLQKLSRKEQRMVLLTALFRLNGPMLNHINSLVKAHLTGKELKRLNGTALICSITGHEGQLYFAKEALEWGADPNKGWKLNGNPIPPLAAILEKPEDWEKTITGYVNLLLSYGANPDLEYKLPDGTTTTPLKAAQAMEDETFIRAVNNWRRSHANETHKPLKNRQQGPVIHKTNLPYLHPDFPPPHRPALY